MRQDRSLTIAALIAILLVLAGCGVRARVEEPFPRKLSQWHLFKGKLSSLQPNTRVIPYDVNSPLFSDYATKYRFVWMPPGTSAIYHPTEAFTFPAGTILVKTFAYDTLIETRLLVHAKSGWVGLPYVWNREQTEATLEAAADPTVVHWRQNTIDYIIPNMNQCKGCHDKSKTMVPIGLTARNLNRNNQLADWTRLGYLKGAPKEAPKLPVWDDPSTGSVEARARAYLEINCAHCHNPQGPANNTGLYLTAAQTDPLRLGLCKVPVSTGRGSANLLFDVVQGKPEESILVYRMESTEPKILMPELGRTLVHKEGVALIRQWIAGMQPGSSTFHNSFTTCSQ